MNVWSKSKIDSSQQNAISIPNSGWFQRWLDHQSAETVRLRVQRIIANSDFLSKEASQRDLEEKQIPVIQRESFELGDLLGKGTFAQVYAISRKGGRGAKENVNSKGCCTRTSKSIVIKQLHPNMYKNHKYSLQEFQQAATDLVMETMFLSRFRSENIVSVEGVSVAVHHCIFGEKEPKHDQQDYYFIMERIPETLDQRIAQWIAQGRPCKSLLFTHCQYALQLATVCHYLQERRIIYRDLKPSNIGINGDTIKLFDFGTCRELPPAHLQSAHQQVSRDHRHFRYYKGLLSEEVYCMSMVGTQRYLAPEVLTTRLYNGKADVYSWAIVVAELLIMEEPFSGFTPAQHYQRVVQQGERPAIAALGLPHSLEALLRHSWAADLSTRPNMSQVLNHMKIIAQRDIPGTSGISTSASLAHKNGAHNDEIVNLD